jgi:hypothetical protein
MTFSIHGIKSRSVPRGVGRLFRRLGVSAGLAAIAVAAPLSLAAPPSAPDSPEKIEPLLIGSPVPDAQVRTADGQQKPIAEVLGGDPAVIVFYRGGW